MQPADILQTLLPKHGAFAGILALQPLLLLCATGCREQYETVQYDVPTVASTRELVFKRTGFGETSMKPETLSPPVSVEEQLAFSGQVDAAMPPRKRGMLRIIKQQGQTSVLCRNSGVALEATGEEAGFSFRSEVKAPKVPGKYRVEIRFKDAFLAIGEITVRKETGH